MIARRWAAAATLTLVLAACGSDGGQPTSTTAAVPGTTTTTTAKTSTTAAGPGSPAARWGAAAVAVCDAARRASTDREAARVAFFDRAHDALHELAAALEEVDRSATAGLLEAKQAVESRFRAPVDPDRLPADLFRLASVTGEALRRLAIDAPNCEK